MSILSKLAIINKVLYNVLNILAQQIWLNGIDYQIQNIVFLQKLV